MPRDLCFAWQRYEDPRITFNYEQSMATCRLVRRIQFMNLSFFGGLLALRLIERRLLDGVCSDSNESSS
ncbi:MAG: hypothetical protein ACI835_004073 [Planctomycetota bacterium]|jgi:hypothetical protein